MITETMVTSVGADGRVNIAPMGVREVDGEVLLAPFRPSTTLNNLLETRCAVVNLVDDVRIFAGCLTGHRDWPLCEAQAVQAPRLRAALTHRELEVVRVEDDEVRPRIFAREIHSGVHAPFAGFNRAQAAVIEAAVLVSRLHMTPPEKIDQEIAYLQIAVDKTAGPREQQAWDWLMLRISEFRGG